MPVFPIVSADDLRKGRLQRPNVDGIIYIVTHVRPILSAGLDLGSRAVSEPS
jgi:hypothetical protein